MLVGRGGAEPLTHMSLYGLGGQPWAERGVLAVVGPCPYAPHEVARTLGIGQVGFLPWDARTVAAISGTRRTVLRTSGFRTPPLMAAARTLARGLIGHARVSAGGHGAEGDEEPGFERSCTAPLQASGERGGLS
ncbi:hypothetical protein CRI70_32115 [Streptomyces sp. Ru87]|nr:hypothetical protein CRI70_32115 [Streptomyces sp. Ru87]